MKAKRSILLLSVLFLASITGACLARNISLEVPDDDPQIEAIETPTPAAIPPEEEHPTATALRSGAIS